MTIASCSHAVLWSPRQKAFSVETIEDMITTNLAVFAGQLAGDFIVLGLAPSHESASELCSDFMTLRGAHFANDVPRALVPSVHSSLKSSHFDALPESH